MPLGWAVRRVEGVRRRAGRRFLRAAACERPPVAGATGGARLSVPRSAGWLRAWWLAAEPDQVAREHSPVAVGVKWLAAVMQ